MIILEHEQGSAEWFKSRLAVATASMFNNVMTSKQLKRAKSVYIYELAAEAIAKESQQTFTGNEHTDRGHELEPAAAAYYAFMFDADVYETGLCLPFEGAQYGCSPDRLVGKDGGLEIKSPELKTHIKYTVEAVVPSDYLHQVYGCLYVTGRDWWDFMSYHEQAQPFIIQTTKEDAGYKKWAAAFDVVLPEFIADLNEIIEKLRVN